MPRVIGIDPGTVTIDFCGLEDGRVFLDRSFPTAEALADPAAVVALLRNAGPLDLIAGPSGYGLAVTPAAQATDEQLHLAFLARFSPRKESPAASAVCGCSPGRSRARGCRWCSRRE